MVTDTLTAPAAIGVDSTDNSGLPGFDDGDGDGAIDACDTCADFVDPAQADRDGDGLGDPCDTCPDDPDPDPSDTDVDGLGDVCDRCPDGDGIDSDLDSVPCADDNCPAAANPDQGDSDGDLLGDACDACPADPGNDADGDGVCGDQDNCNVFYDPNQTEVVRVSGRLQRQGRVYQPWWSPDGLTVVYVADQDTDEVFELYSRPRGLLPFSANLEQIHAQPGGWKPAGPGLRGFRPGHGSCLIRRQRGGEAAGGANGLQNFPVLVGKTPAGPNTQVDGILRSTPLTNFVIDLYDSAAADPSGHGEGDVHLGTVSVTTDVTGNVPFSFLVPGTVNFPSTTATGPGGNTSEFSGAFAWPQEVPDTITVGQAGSLLEVDYVPACGAANHAVFWGESPILGTLTWIGGSFQFDPGLPPPGSFIYFVVVGQTAGLEGSYGQDSATLERPEASLAGTCDQPLSLGGVCP